MPRIPGDQLVIGVRLSPTEGACGIVHAAQWRTTRVHGVEVAEVVLPVAVKVGWTRPTPLSSCARRW